MTDAAVNDRTISFVITTVHGDRVGLLLRIIESARRPGDEVILLTSSGDADHFVESRSWLRVVCIPDASIFTLRAHIPAACRGEWVIALEDHSLLEPSTVDAIRCIIRERPDADMIPFLVKNLTSRRTWDWAIFLYNFALVWAPLDHPPPYSIVTSVIVRRAILKTEAPLKAGEWELRVIPGAFSTGNWTYANEIFIDHVKPLNLVEAITIIFHNARAGADLQRNLGIPARNVIREGWFAFAPRPGQLMQAVAARRNELPSGTRLRLHVLGLTHLIGNLAGVMFGAGRSAHLID